MDASGQPLANLRCVLQVEGDNRSVTTDAAGRIVQRIPFAAEKALLIAGTKELEMRIGHLDPEAEVSGWYARLSNLGYPVGESDEPDDERLRFAIEEFQCDQGMQVTGVCDAATQAKLKELHGC
jgi:hypothetical protein